MTTGSKLWKRGVGLLLGTLALATVAVPVRSALLARADLHPTRQPVRSLQGRADLAGFQPVAFSAADGVGIRGWWLPPRNGSAIILVHGWGESREQMVPQALMLARHGFGVLAFDLRAHGESGGELSTSGDQERRDVRAAIDFAATRPDVGPGSIGIVGFSIGALAAADVAIDDGRVAAIVLEAMHGSLEELVIHDYGAHGFLTELPARWTYRASGVDVADLAPGERICGLAPRPLLLIYGERDPEAPVGEGRQVLARSCGPASMWVVPGGGHGGWSGDEVGALEARLVTFFSESLASREVHRRNGL